MSVFLSLTVVGLVTGGLYALTSSGLVVTYTVSGIFNFAHGAIGMFAAFGFWELVVVAHVPSGVALPLIVCVAAPAFGAIVERFVMRRLRGAPVEVTMVVTIGLMLALVGLAETLWPSSTPRIPPTLFPGHSVEVFGISITYEQLVILGTVAAIAVALRLFLFGTGPGIAMRATVDDAELAARAGVSPTRYGQLGWALGALLAALAGILIAPLTSLDATVLTLLVVEGYAAAMLGRLRSLPLTFAGGLVLGLAVTYGSGYLPVGPGLNLIQPAIPVIFLFGILLILPERSLRAARPRVSILRVPRVPSRNETIGSGIGFVIVAAVVLQLLSPANVLVAGHGLAYAVIAVSLVPLVGYAGQMSLCQLTFAGIGAVVASHVDGGGSLLAPLAAAGAGAIAGALLALPAMRLRGLYLALATLAFAETMDTVFFNNPSVFGLQNALSLRRFDVFGVSLQSDRAFALGIAVAFALIAIGVLALRRSFLGRRIVAMSDSEDACASLGMSRVWTRVGIFALSAAIAGFGGALYGEQQLIVGPSDFQYLSSLVLLLLVMLGGIRSVSGALFAAIVLAVFPVIEAHVSWLSQISFLLTGLAAIQLGAKPNGVAGDFAELRSKLRGGPDAAIISNRGSGTPSRDTNDDHVTV